METCGKIFCVFHAILFIFNFISFIFFEIAYTKTSNLDFSFPTEIANNWSLKLFTDLTLTGLTGCTQDNLFINTKWQGLKEGCSCNNNNNDIHIGKCTGDFKSNKCYNIPYTEPKSLGMWDNRLICKSGQINTNTYLEHQISSKTCKVGFSSCGIIDDNKNILCLPTGSICPINDIIIVPKNSGNSFPGYKFLDLETKRIYYTNKNTNGNILVTAQYGDGTPCASSSKINFLYYEKYKLDNSTSCLDSNEINPNYIEIDNSPQKWGDILKSQGIYNLAESYFITLPKYENHVYLYYKGYAGIQVQSMPYVISELKNIYSSKTTTTTTTSNIPFTTFYDTIRNFKSKINSRYYDPAIEASRIINIINFVFLFFHFLDFLILRMIFWKKLNNYYGDFLEGCKEEDLNCTKFNCFLHMISLFIFCLNLVCLGFIAAYFSFNYENYSGKNLGYLDLLYKILDPTNSKYYDRFSNDINLSFTLGLISCIFVGFNIIWILATMYIWDSVAKENDIFDLNLDENIQNNPQYTLNNNQDFQIENNNQPINANLNVDPNAQGIAPELVTNQVNVNNGLNTFNYNNIAVLPIPNNNATTNNLNNNHFTDNLKKIPSKIESIDLNYEENQLPPPILYNQDSMGGSNNNINLNLNMNSKVDCNTNADLNIKNDFKDDFNVKLEIELPSKDELLQKR